MKPETLARIHRPHIETGKLANPRPGTPQEGEYALGWGVVKFDWTKVSVLAHNGSNTMNLAKILVDPDQDLGVVVMTNFPERQAEDAASSLLKALYCRYGTCA